MPKKHKPVLPEDDLDFSDLIEDPALRNAVIDYSPHDSARIHAETLASAMNDLISQGKNSKGFQGNYACRQPKGFEIALPHYVGYGIF